MSKDYTATELDDVKVLLRIPAYNYEMEEYHIGSLKITGTVKNGSFSFPIRSPVNGVDFLGSGQSTQFTKQEIYSGINGYNNFNTYLANKLKQLYIDAINVDPST